MQYGIRWRQGDYISLGKAVSNFNKKLNELQREQRKLYLPLEIDYQSLKKDIYTRAELNRTIKSLKAFMKEGAENIEILEGGQAISKWEYNNLKQMRANAKRSLKRELKSISPNLPYSTPEERVLRGTIHNIDKLETKIGKEFLDIQKRVNYVGRSDYEYKKALIWKENFLKAVEENYSSFENYDKLMEYLKNFQNPIVFFNLFKNNTEHLIEDYISLLSDKTLSQNAFNHLLWEIGVPNVVYENTETVLSSDNKLIDVKSTVLPKRNLK